MSETRGLAKLREIVAGGQHGHAPPPGSAARPDPLSVACPTCKAVVGAGCKNYRGKGCAPHGARVRLARGGTPPPSAADVPALVLRALEAGLVLHANDRTGVPLTCGKVDQLFGPPRWAIYRYAGGGGPVEEPAVDPPALARLFLTKVAPGAARRAARRALDDAGPKGPVPAPPPTPRPTGMRMLSFGLTDVGRVRTENQDRFRIAPLGDGEAYILADGMGGMGGGEVASDTAVSAVSAALPDLLPVTKAKLRGLVEKANDAVVAEQTRLGGGYAQMGTTLTIAVALADRLYVAHTGDSRCYLVDEQGHARPLTADQTVTQQLLGLGQITEAQAKRHHLRHVLSSCVGCTVVQLDVQVLDVALRPGDAVVLCSDGLHDRVGDDDIGHIVRTAPGPEQACQRLVALANNRGGSDNITVIVAYVREGAP
jgi:protein phosphatase